MKKILIFIFCSLFLFSCSWEKSTEKGLENTNSKKINITTSIVPLASITNYIWWEKVKVDSVVPVWISPHGFDLKAEQMVWIEKSDLIIYVWLEHIDWFLDKVIPKEKSLKVSDWISLLEAQDHHDEEEWHEEENHQEEEHSIDWHIWTSGENTKIIAEKITQQLAKISPENASLFQENYKNLVKEIDETINNFKNEVSWKKINNFIIFHDAYNYLFKEIWVEQDKKHIFQKSVLSDPNGKEMKELIDDIKNLNIKTAFKEPQLNDGNLQKLSNEYDIKILELNPLWNNIEASWYIENLKNNLENLKNIYE